MKLGKCAARLVFRGKHKNVAACAVGRKLLTYAWHVMRGDPTPKREDEDFFRRKMVRFYGVPEARRMKSLGYKNAKDFAERRSKALYGRLPAAKNNSEQPAN